MVFYLLISIVFLAEIIITTAILIHFVKLDKCVSEWSDFLEDIKPQVSEIMKTYKEISEKLLELAPKLVDKVKNLAKKFFIDQLKTALAGLTFWSVKKEVEKRFI